MSVFKSVEQHLAVAAVIGACSGPCKGKKRDKEQIEVSLARPDAEEALYGYGAYDLIIIGPVQQMSNKTRKEYERKYMLDICWTRQVIIS